MGESLSLQPNQRITLVRARRDMVIEKGSMGGLITRLNTVAHTFCVRNVPSREHREINVFCGDDRTHHGKRICNELKISKGKYESRK